MTNAEWRPMARLIASCWRGEFTPAQAEDYFRLLAPYPVEGVEAALHLLVQDPKPFVPSVSEIVDAMRRMTEAPVPGWSQAWEALQRAMKKRDAEEALAVAREVHPVVAAFMRSEGGRDRMAAQPFFDEQYGGIRIAELRQRWEDFVDVARERQRQGIAIEAATGRSEIGAPHRLEFAALMRAERAPEHKQIGEGS